MSSYWVQKAQVGSNTQCKSFFKFIKIDISFQNIDVFSSKMKSLYRNRCFHALYASNQVLKVCVLVLFLNKGGNYPQFWSTLYRLTQGKLIPSKSWQNFLSSGVSFALMRENANEILMRRTYELYHVD